MMTTSPLRLKYVPVTLSLAAILAAFLLSVVLRLSVHSSSLNYTNYDATWHVLLTMQAQRENRLPAHLGLPIVTLGGTDNKFYPWGATIATARGDYLYTSFPPLGFMVPATVFQILNLENTVAHLMIFNFALHLIGALGVFFFTVELFQILKFQRLYIGSTLLTITYLFTTETLFSHGVIYWSHSLFQVVFIFYLLHVIHSLKMEKPTNARRAVNFVFVFLLSLIDWTGLFVAVGSGIVLYTFDKGTRKEKLLSLSSSWLSAAAAMLVFSLWFLALIPPWDFIRALVIRFFARNAVSGSIVDLLAGYVESFALLPLLLIGLILLIRQKPQHPVLTGITFITLAAIAENFIIMQHAIEYTFDRLKLFFLIIPAFVILWRTGRAARWFSLFVLIISIGFAVNLYTVGSPVVQLPRFVPGMDETGGAARIWDVSAAFHENEQILNGLDIDHSFVIGISAKVRGFINLEWHRGIAENTNPLELAAYAPQRNAPNWIFLNVADTGNQIYHYRSLLFSVGGELGLRYLNTELAFGSLGCDLIETSSIIHECSEEQLRERLRLPADSLQSENDSDLLTALLDQS